ncbi:tyrosine-type recombinase/integrase [Rhodococcus sp. IEGM1428]|uniref:tyrosine-type recombinase/integrase n=1 Tax=Rhodococcus sp. IEGM1428 TaxID=3392191 RepID=UPI003D0A5AE5
MATVDSYTTAAGKRYRVRYRTPDRRQTDKRGFKTKRDALAFLSTVEVEMMRGEYVPPGLGRITVSEFGPQWLSRKESDLKPSAYKSIETAWRVHVSPRWGTTRLADITLDSVERWIADLGRAGKGATVVIRAYGVLAGVLDSAVKAKRLAKNPARGVENLPRKQRKSHVYLSHTEVHELAAASGQHRVLVFVLAYCGIRWGEAIGLRVRHLDLLRKRLNVVDNAVQVDNKIHVGTPKSHKTRAVPVPAFLVGELAQICVGKGRDDLVFSGRNGDYLRRSVSSTGWFTRAVVTSGVPRLTPHDLRHTAASLSISAGVNVKALQRMLGHASAAMTLDVYADLFDDDLDAVAVALDRAMSAQVVGRVWADQSTDAETGTEKGP